MPLLYTGMPLFLERVVYRRPLFEESKSNCGDLFSILVEFEGRSCSEEFKVRWYHKIRKIFWILLKMFVLLLKGRLKP